jgi:UDP-glucose 4-epimerase
MTTALITGGAGSIGSQLAEELLKRGDEVYVLDDLSTGSINNIKHLKTNPRFHYVIDTMMHESLLAELIDGAEVVYHLAAAVGVFLVAESPIYTIETTVKGTELVLKWANKKKRKVLLTSSSEVYGKGTRIPFTETDDLIIGPSNMGRWSYACSKLLDEFMTMAYYKQYSLPVVVARLFNTVGPRQVGRYGMVIPRLVTQALKNEPLTVFGDGKQTRSFCHVRDCVHALISLMESEQTNGEIYNVGNPDEITIESLAQSIVAATNSQSEIKYVPYEQAYTENFEDTRRRVPNIAKIQAAIGWTPQIPLAEILAEVISAQTLVGGGVTSSGLR